MTKFGKVTDVGEKHISTGSAMPHPQRPQFLEDRYLHPYSST